MATVTQASPQLEAERRMLFSGVLWETYEVMREDPGLYRVRMTYRNGELELMTPSFSHERLANLVGRFLEIATLELRIGICSGRSFTLKAHRAKSAVEPDECYYIANEAMIRGKDVVDLRHDPPPDLVIESEISRTVLERLPIYIELGVPEIWRVRPDRVEMLALTEGKEYRSISASNCLPLFTPEILFAFLQKRDEVDETELVQSFLEWVREQRESK